MTTDVGTSVRKIHEWSISETWDENVIVNLAFRTQRDENLWTLTFMLICGEHRTERASLLRTWWHRMLYDAGVNSVTEYSLRNVSGYSAVSIFRVKYSENWKCVNSKSLYYVPHHTVSQPSDTTGVMLESSWRPHSLPYWLKFVAFCSISFTPYWHSAFVRNEKVLLNLFQSAIALVADRFTGLTKAQHGLLTASKYL